MATEMGYAYLAGLSYRTAQELGVMSADLHSLRENEGNYSQEGKKILTRLK